MDAAVEVVDSIVGVALQGAPLKHKPGALLSCHDGKLFAPLHQRSTGEVVEASAGRLEFVMSSAQPAHIFGPKDACFAAPPLFEGVLEVHQTTIDGAVVAEELQALELCPEVTGERVRCVGLDEHIERAS